MTEIRISTHSIQQPSLLSNTRMFNLNLPHGVHADYVYACIHDVGEGRAGIRNEVLIQPSRQGAFVLILDLSTVGQGRAFQIRAYQKLEDGTPKEVARLVGASHSLSTLEGTLSLDALST